MKRLKSGVFGVFAPLYNRAVMTLAYSELGSISSAIIWFFKKMYGINHSAPNSQFACLGDFFLRDVPFELAEVSLVSPVEARALEGPKKLDFEEKMDVKGIRYSWKQFRELDVEKFKNGAFWNLYLAPSDYHWVHSAVDGEELEAFYTRGKKWPVNALGRWLSPLLYSENERITFRCRTTEWGEVAMICVGALGVSALDCVKGAASAGRWTFLARQVRRGEKLLGFRLGSTVLLLVEKAPPLLTRKERVRVGDALY